MNTGSSSGTTIKPRPKCVGRNAKSSTPKRLDDAQLRVQETQGFTQTMTWNGHHPVVQWVEKIYQTGQRLTQKAMAALERQWMRCPALPKWFVHMAPTAG